MDTGQGVEVVELLRQLRDMLYLGVWSVAFASGQLAVNMIIKARAEKWF